MTAASAPSGTAERVQYPPDFIARLHAVWGDGFLSPGGADEVLEIVRGVDLKNAHVLDVGCGTGGPSIVLANRCGAAAVTAIDIEPQLLEIANENAAVAGTSGRIDLQLVQPGPLPFEDGSFDAVLSKDALVHIPDKAAMFREIVRVLRPGGTFVASDWLSGQTTATSPEWARYREIGHLEFTMANADETSALMRGAGLRDVTTRDRTEWYAERSRDEMRRIDGALREPLIAAVGQSTYLHWREVRQALTDAVGAGALRPTHLRGLKPRA